MSTSRCCRMPKVWCEAKYFLACICMYRRCSPATSLASWLLYRQVFSYPSTQLLLHGSEPLHPLDNGFRSGGGGKSAATFPAPLLGLTLLALTAPVTPNRACARQPEPRAAPARRPAVRCPADRCHSRRDNRHSQSV